MIILLKVEQFCLFSDLPDRRIQTLPINMCYQIKQYHWSMAVHCNFISSLNTLDQPSVKISRVKMTSGAYLPCVKTGCSLLLGVNIRDNGLFILVAYLVKPRTFEFDKTAILLCIICTFYFYIVKKHYPYEC